MYYLLDNQNQQIGPFTVEQLQVRGLSRNSLIWRQGLSNWTEAYLMSDLSGLFTALPPPPVPSPSIQSKTNPPNSNSEQLSARNPSGVFEAVVSDTGYFLIALLILLNDIVWFVWGLFFQNSITGNENFYKLFRIFSVVILVGQFVILLIFTKKLSYKIIIAIVSFLVFCYAAFYLIKDIRRF